MMLQLPLPVPPPKVGAHNMHAPTPSAPAEVTGSVGVSGNRSSPKADAHAPLHRPLRTSQRPFISRPQSVPPPAFLTTSPASAPRSSSTLMTATCPAWIAS